MFDILTLNKISPIGLDKLDKKYNVLDVCDNPDGIVLRSFKMHDMEFKENLVCVARAGAGVNNIPIDKCSEKGIVVFNTPGANANAVKELVITGLMLASRKVVEGIKWLETEKNNPEIATLVEKEKSKFIGPEILGKKIGIIGLGAIGILVANTCNELGMEVYGFDPLLTVNNALLLSNDISLVNSMEEIFSTCDYVTIHIPLNDKTKGIIDLDMLKNSKDIRILNLARGGIVNEDDLIVALNEGYVEKYVTDFPNQTTLSSDKIINIPHLGASTPESEDNCAMMATKQLKKYIETGNIENSVNFPDVSLPFASEYRVCILHKNIPNVLALLTAFLGKENINVDELVNKSRGDLAYTMVDIDKSCDNILIEKISSMDEVFKVRQINIKKIKG